jgi:hypothetical protein
VSGHFLPGPQLSSTYPVPWQVGHSWSGVHWVSFFSSSLVPLHSELASQIPSMILFPWQVGQGRLFVSGMVNSSW